MILRQLRHYAATPDRLSGCQMCHFRITAFAEYCFRQRQMSRADSRAPPRRRIISHAFRPLSWHTLKPRPLRRARFRQLSRLSAGQSADTPLITPIFSASFRQPFSISS